MKGLNSSGSAYADPSRANGTAAAAAVRVVKRHEDLLSSTRPRRGEAKGRSNSPTTAWVGSLHSFVAYRYPHPLLIQQYA